MKILNLILSVLGLTSIAAAQTSGVISYPVNGEVMGGTYASQGTASTMTGGAVIPGFASTTAALSASSTTIVVASAAGIVSGELVVSANIPAGTKVVSISGPNVVLSALPSAAGSAVAVTFQSMYLNFDGGPGCGGYCSLSVAGAGTASASYYAPIYAGLGEWAAGPHTISLTVVDSMGAISTTGTANVTVYNSSPTGNCSSTLISSSIYCMEAAVAATAGPTASLILNGPFQAGDVVHASQFLLRPASPYTMSIASSLTATQTNVTISAPPIITGTASTTNANPVITLDATGYGNVCGTRLGQVITGSPGIAAGTTVIKCLGSNQVLLSQAATATASGTSVAMQFTWPAVSGIAAASVGASGGSGYAQGDLLNVTQAGASGGQVMVTSIGAGGSVTGVAPMASTPANFYTASGYSNASNLSTSPLTGSGSGASVNITAGFIATITDQGYGPGYEQWCVTGISGVNWTVVRGCNGTAPIAHLAGMVGAFDPGPYPILPSYMTDSAGNTWTLVERVQTDFTDNNTVDAAVYYTTFTSGTAAVANAALRDTLTFTHPYAQLGQVDMNAVRYRGLGSIGNTNNPEVTNGYAAPDSPGGTPFNSSMTSNRVIPTAAGNVWPVSPGDLCIITAVGSPFMVVNNSPPGPPINALLYPLGGSGTVSVSGNVVSLLTGTSFSTAYTSSLPSAWQPGSPIVLGGTTYHIASITNSTRLTTIETPTPSGSETYTVANGGSAPNPASGWVLREKDPSRMYVIDNIANSTSCNGGALVTNVDGMGTLGVAFHPAAGSTTVYGQSARITSANGLANASVPAVSLSNGTASVDFEIDNLNMTHNANFLGLNDIGFTFAITQIGGGVYLLDGSNSHFSGWDGKGNSTETCGGNPYGFTISNVASIGGNLPIYARYQVDYGSMKDYFELWDGTGARIYAQYCGWTSVTGSPANGIVIGNGSYTNLSSPDTMQVGFLWQRSTILPMNSKMPTFGHSNAGCVYDYHFDTATGNTTDSCSAGPYNLTATGTVTYPNTASAVQALIKAIPTQFGTVATSISGWATMNAATGTQQMDCLAQSVIQYNASDIPSSCTWSQIQGPALTGMPSSVTQPTISGIVPTNLATNALQFPTPHFSAAMARTKTGTGNTHILCIGDSVCAGYPNQVYNSWFSQLSLSGVTTAPGLAVYADALVGGTSIDSRWIPGGNWTEVLTGNLGFGYASAWFGSTGTLVFTPAGGGNPSPPTYDSFKIWYATNSGFGTFTATATGGTGTTVNTNGAVGFGTAVVSAGSAGTSNTLTIGSLSGGSVYVLAIEGILSTSSLVYFDNASPAGASAQQWSSSVNPWSSIELIRAKAPDLCIIALGNNDAAASTPTATYLSYMQSIINACKASGDVILQTTWPQQMSAASYPLDVLYHAALLPFAAGQSIPVIDIWGHYNGVYQSALSYSDGVHPNTMGYAAIAGLSNAVISTPAVGGDYILSLTVSDLESPPVTSAPGTIEMGAAPLDANGVVTNITGPTAQFFGPLMAYGYIPWGEADTIQYYMIGAQTAYQATVNQYQQWATYPSAGGTVTWPFSAKGEGLGIPGTITTASILATSTAIPIQDSTKISSTFPTWIMLGAQGNNNGYEIVRVCSASAGTPPAATLNVCYDGRGLSSNASASNLLNLTAPAGASSWSPGTTVGEMRFQGSGTLFVSDSTRPIAQAGAPGPIGLITTSTGNVSLAAGSATMTCSTSCGWASAIVGQNVLITGTTHSSTPFNFWREITGFTDSAHVTLDHAAPAGMDAYSGPYHLTIPQYISFELPAPQDNHTIRLLQVVFGCESETACFGLGVHDIPQLDASTISGAKYSYQTGAGMAGNFGPNFYGTDLALWNFYLRSGYTPALNLAKSISEYWVRSPEVGDVYQGNETLNIGGGVNGAAADLLINPSTSLTWANVENAGISTTFSYLLNASTLAPLSCDLDDSRDTGIMGGWGGLLANWDTNTGTGTLSGNVGAGSTGGTVTGWTGTGNYLTPPFLALINLAGSDTTYEFIRVTSISGTTWTWTPSYYIPGGTSAFHTSGAQILSGAAMYTLLLSKLDVRDQGCRRNAIGGYSGPEVNSWANTSNFPPTGLISLEGNGPLTMTNGSAASTSTGSLSPYMCNGKDIGTLITTGTYTAQLQGGSTVGNVAYPWLRIYVWDGTTLAALSYTSSGYGVTGATLTFTGSLAAAGLTCSLGSPCTYMTSTTGAFTAIWNSNSDSFADNEALKKNWECVWNSSISITLNRPWDGPSTVSGSPVFYSGTYTTQGFEQQPFMLGGYKVTGMRWAQHSSNPTVASDYVTMSQQAGTWARNYGWDYTNSRGSFYTAVTQVCNPVTLPFNLALTVSPFSTYISTLHGGDGGSANPGCGAVGSSQPNGGANGLARVNAVEMGSAIKEWFNINPAGNKSTADSYYGALMGGSLTYGANAGCSSSVSSTCDGNDASNCELNGMNGYKWPGFCFGMGGFFSTSYPALRTLGQSPYNPVPISGHGSIVGGFGLAP